MCHQSLNTNFKMNFFFTIFGSFFLQVVVEIALTYLGDFYLDSSSQIFYHNVITNLNEQHIVPLNNFQIRNKENLVFRRGHPKIIAMQTCPCSKQFGNIFFHVSISVIIVRRIKLKIQVCDGMTVY